MKDSKATIIVGGTAAERTQEAHSRATALGSPYVVTCWNEFCSGSDFANVLKVKPEVVIVEGLPDSLSAENFGLIKSRLSGDTIAYRPLHSREVFVAWSPAFVFTASAGLPEVMSINLSLHRRFDVVEL